MDEYWVVNCRRFGRSGAVVAFGPDREAAEEFARDMRAAGREVGIWDMLAGRSAKERKERP